MSVSASWYGNAAPRNDDDEIWYVAVAPDDVKRMTVEQLDDAFRLDIVDAGTHVWQPGMSAWQTLGTMAGLEAPETTPTSGRALHVVASAAQRPAPPPPSVSPPASVARPVPVAARPAPLAQTMPLAAPSVPHDRSRGAAPVVVPLPGARGGVGATVSTVRMDASPLAITPIAQAPSAVIRAAAAPVVRPMVSEVATPAPVRLGRFGATVLTVAALAGILSTLYRNDILRDQARGLGLQGAYAAIEEQLGVPGFGTPRSIEQLELRFDVPRPSSSSQAATKSSASDTAPSGLEPGHGAPVDTVPSPTPGASAEPKSGQAEPVAEKPAAAAEKPAANGEKTHPPAPPVAVRGSKSSAHEEAAPGKAPEPEPNAASRGRSAASPEEKVEALLGGRPTSDAPKASPSPQAPPTRRTVGNRESAAPRANKSSGKRGNEYDPLNSDL